MGSGVLTPLTIQNAVTPPTIVAGMPATLQVSTGDTVPSLRLTIGDTNSVEKRRVNGGRIKELNRGG